MTKLPLLLLLAACGGKSSSPATAPRPAGQDLTDATARLCAAPMRAQSDPDWRGDSAADNIAVIGKHARDGITNTRVLAFTTDWQNGSKGPDQLRVELDALTHEANLSSHCKLLDVFTPPVKQEIE